MPVTVEWHDPAERILRYTYTDPWQWDDCLRTIEDGRSWMRPKSHAVLTLHDMRDTRKVPASIVSRTKAIIDTRPDNTGLTVFVSGGYLQQTLYTAFIRIRPHLGELYQLVTTMEVAEQKMAAWMRKHMDDDAQQEA